jgi:hypothetical protein
MRLQAIVILIVVVSGCDSVNDERSTFAAHDSSAIEIVEVRWDESLVLTEVESVPDWEIGGPDQPGDLYLHEVRDAVMVGEDRVIIAEGSTQQLLLVDVGAQSVVRLGGAGDGPAEFRGLGQLVPDHDGLVTAYDQRRRRLVTFDEEGRLVRSNSPAVDLPVGPTIVARSRSETDGTRLYIAGVAHFPTEQFDGLFRGAGPVVQFADPTDTLAVIRGAEVFAGGGGAGSVLFGATTLLQGGPEGLWIGDTKQQQVVLWRTGDRPVRIVRWSTEEDRVVTDERKAEFWNRFESALPIGEREAARHMRAVLPFSDAVPAFGGLQVGPRGELWIGSALPPELELLDQPTPAQEWLVVNFGSKRAARVVLPEGFLLFRVGERFVLGLHRDSLGIETVRKYTIDLGQG